jgi:hypothetical protein
MTSSRHGSKEGKGANRCKGNHIVSAYDFEEKMVEELKAVRQGT